MQTSEYKRLNTKRPIKNLCEHGEVTKSLWSYIKKHNLSKGRIITPDATLKKVCIASLRMLVSWMARTCG